MSLRSALGASRRRLVRQLVTESLALSMTGGAIGLLLATWAIRPLLALTTLPRADEVSLDLPVFLFTLFAAMLGPDWPSVSRPGGDRLPDPI